MWARLAHASATRCKVGWGWLIWDGLSWEYSSAPHGVSYLSRLISLMMKAGEREKVEVFYIFDTPSLLPHSTGK